MCHTGRDTYSEVAVGMKEAEMVQMADMEDIEQKVGKV